MKKILFSLATIGLMSSLAIGATRAYFTAQGTVAGQTISSGTLSLDASETGTYNTSLLNASNLAPGDITGPVTVTIKNDGTLNAATFGKIRLTGDTGLASGLKIYNYRVQYYDSTGNPVNRWAVDDNYYGSARNEDWFIKDGQSTLWTGVGGKVALSEWVNGDGPLDIPGTAWDIEGMEPEEYYTVTLQFQMDPTADDTYQGKSVNIGYEVKATQNIAEAMNNLLGRSDMNTWVSYLNDQFND